MAEAQDKGVFRRFYEGAWNDGDLGVVEGSLDEGFVSHDLANVAVPRRDPRRLSRLDDRHTGPRPRRG